MTRADHERSTNAEDRRTLVAAITLAASSIVALAVPASAEPGTRARFNMWQHDSDEGQHEARKKYDNDLHNDSCSGCDPGPGGNFGDDMSSFVNKTKYWWLIYTDKLRNGDVFCVRPRSHDADLGNNGFSNLEDEISSIIRTYRTGKSAPVIACSDNKKRILGYAN